MQRLNKQYFRGLEEDYNIRLGTGEKYLLNRLLPRVRVGVLESDVLNTIGFHVCDRPGNRYRRRTTIPSSDGGVEASYLHVHPIAFNKNRIFL